MNTKRLPIDIPLRSSYPPIEPFRHGTIAVDDRHVLYWEQCGNPAGKNVILLHGGPGSGSYPALRQFHNPEKYCMTLFDQRGCGRSTPFADLVNNTTWDLVDDIEKIRKELGIASWQVFGGSWGSTLAIAYAETYPQYVTELVIRGVALFRDWEVQFLFQEGISRIFADEWESFVSLVPEAERGDMISAYQKMLTSDDVETQRRAAKALFQWEEVTSQLVPVAPRTDVDMSSKDISRGRIENHYFANLGFFKTNQLLNDAHRIAHIPGTIAQGRYDMVCPFQSAWDFAKAWPKGTLIVAQQSGHFWTEKELMHILVEATDMYAEK